MNMKRRRFQLKFYEAGGVELLSNGATVWASDNDPDFNEEFGDDVLAEELDDADPDDAEDFADELIDDVLNYLVEKRYLTTSQADMCDVDMPEEIDAEETSE
jgi:hypothetical protein